MATKIVAHPTGSNTFPEFFETIGGVAFFIRLGTCFYELVSADELLAPLFPAADWARQATLLSSHFIRLWGRDDPAEAWRPGLLKVHTRWIITHEQRRRWLELIRQAAADAGAPDERLEEFITFMRLRAGQMTAVSRGAAVARGESFGWNGHPAVGRDQRGGA